MKIKWLLAISILSGVMSIEIDIANANQETISTLTSIKMEELSSIIGEAKTNLMSKKIKDPSGEYWSMPGYLGTHYVSQYYLFTRWFGIQLPAPYKENLLNLILSRQNKKGGFWLALEDANLSSPNAIDPSIYHYWALKVLKTEFPQRQVEIDTALTKAKIYILKSGGAENSVLFTKVVMALFGNYSWDNIPYIPSVTYNALISPFVVDKFSQWVIPHLKPLGYIRAHRIAKSDLGAEFSIKELFLNQASWQKQRSSSLLNSGLGWLEKLSRSEAAPLHSFAEYNWKHLVEKEIIPHQKPRGSWGGYTLSTLFSLVTIDHYYNHDFSQKREIEQQMKKGFSFLQTLYFNTGSSSLQGVLDDGSYWDTALALRALRENGIANEEIQNSAQFLANLQQKNGAFPFGYDFEDYSDVDDTVETVFALENLNLAHYNEKKALKFVANFQNRDFGWGTFDKNNTGNALLRIFTQNFNDSAEMFDISRPDVTGHALELLGHFGYTSTKSPQVAKSIHYLRLQRDKKTMASWMGRWAVNHIFGTSAVITGLRAVGLPSKDPIIQDAIRWLKSIQNKDGGFGETTESYQDIRLLAANKGVSTASQTGWAIMALVDGGEAQSEATSKAVDFLMKQFRENGQSSGSTGFWTDASVTGTGHPGLIYMIYPSYPYTWPLIALGKYMRAVCKVESHPHQNYCENYLRK